MPLVAALGAIVVGVLVAFGLLLASHLTSPGTTQPPYQGEGTGSAPDNTGTPEPGTPDGLSPEQPPSPTPPPAETLRETVLPAQPALQSPGLGEDILDLPPTPTPGQPSADPSGASTQDPGELSPAPLISAYPVPPGLADEAAPSRLIFTSQDPAGEEVIRTLLAFLRAPDWRTRLAHTLLPEAVQPAMEGIYSVVDDGPIPIAQIEFLGATSLDDEDDAFFHCNLHDPAIPGGTLRVVLAREGESYGVDWVFFAQTYHRIFDRFAAAPTEGTYRFNLTLRRVHTLRADFPDVPDLADKDAFEAACSGNLSQPTVFVRDGSEVASTLKAFIPWRGGRELPQFVVADLRWDTSEGQPIILVERFHQLGWHPDPEIYATGRVE